MSEKNVVTPHDIQTTFNCEFCPIKYLFSFIELSYEEAKTKKEKPVWHPGVYVWLKGTSVIKIGRHFDNSRKRAFEHISWNTNNLGKNSYYPFEMKNLAKDPESKLVLINLKEWDEKNPSHLQNRHWIAAIEVFLEIVMEPVIRSERMG